MQIKFWGIFSLVTSFPWLLVVSRSKVTYFLNLHLPEDKGGEGSSRFREESDTKTLLVPEEA